MSQDQRLERLLDLADRSSTELVVEDLTDFTTQVMCLFGLDDLYRLVSTILAKRDIENSSDTVGYVFVTLIADIMAETILSEALSVTEEKKEVLLEKIFKHFDNKLTLCVLFEKLGQQPIGSLVSPLTYIELHGEVRRTYFDLLS